jgi:hypothetical protein
MFIPLEKKEKQVSAMGIDADFHPYVSKMGDNPQQAAFLGSRDRSRTYILSFKDFCTTIIRHVNI